MFLKLRTSWHEQWLDRLCAEESCVGRRFAEYGIGGGLLGAMLLTDGVSNISRKLRANISAAHYAGIDISQRQLAEARLRLSRLYSPELWSLHNTSVDFRSLRPDIFVCQAVIQHFPSLAYTDAWLQRVDTCGAQRLMLQVRDGRPCCEREVPFANSTTPGAVRHATTVDRSYLERRLPNYRMQWSQLAQGGYVYYTFRRKSGLIELRR